MLTSPSRGYPLERLDGNASTMGGLSEALDEVADELGEMQTEASRAAEVTGSGSAMDSARTGARAICEALTVDIALAERIARVLRTYADAFRTTAEHANALIDDIETAHANVQTAAAEAERAGMNALWTSRSGTDAEAVLANQDARDAVAVRERAEAALAEFWQSYENYYSAWDDAYDAALAGLFAGGSVVLSSEEREFLDDLLAADDPAEAARLWHENPDLHEGLAKVHPDVIGNLDGIPWDARAEANRRLLDQILATEPQGPRREELEHILRALENSIPAPKLISFDPDGSEQVTAALSYGDLSTAAEINSLVPGMNGNVGDLSSWGESAKALNSSVDGSATVVWFGYDTPDLLEEPRMRRAQDGAAELGSYLQALRTLSPDADINVIAHSYGSTTAALAIGSRPDGLGVTAFIAVGSAGFPDDPTTVANLTNDNPPRIYATLSEDDAVARIGRGTAPNHPVSPERLDGVSVFDSDGGQDGAGSALPATPGHGALGPGGYLEPGSESFYNVGEIIETGEPGTERDGAGSTRGFWDEKNWWISDEYAFIDFSIG